MSGESALDSPFELLSRSPLRYIHSLSIRGLWLAHTGLGCWAPYWDWDLKFSAAIYRAVNGEDPSAERVRDNPWMQLYLRWGDSEAGYLEFMKIARKAEINYEKSSPTVGRENSSNLNLSELLASIRERPVLYIQQKSLNNLYSFLGGILLGRDWDPLLPQTKPAIEELLEYVSMKCMCSDTTWHRRLLAGWCLNEEAAFDAFFRIIDGMAEEGEAATGRY